MDMIWTPSFVPHPLHAADQPYRETNCYCDVLIELLHSRGLEPLAGLGHLVRTDFEGDQFTFFKMPPADIELLYGIDIHEMQPVGALPEQIRGQLERGRTMLVELDSFFLPDTAATDYRRNHVKTTVAADAIDCEAETLRYFHNSGLHALSGADFRGVFGLDGRGEGSLPPYLELVRFDCGEPLSGAQLREAALDLLSFHLERRPRSNPFAAFGSQLEARLPALVAGDADSFHAYAFATARMAGACFSLLRAHLAWLLPAADPALFEPIVDSCQILSFRLARRRPFDPQGLIETMAASWAQAMEQLA
jgi:hypothetical protein